MITEVKELTSVHSRLGSFDLFHFLLVNVKVLKVGPHLQDGMNGRQIDGVVLVVAELIEFVHLTRRCIGRSKDELVHITRMVVALLRRGRGRMTGLAVDVYGKLLALGFGIVLVARIEINLQLELVLLRFDLGAEVLFGVVRLVNLPNRELRVARAMF